MEPANKQNYTIKLEENKGKICFKVCLFVRAVAHGYQCLFQSEIHSLKSCNRLLATQFNKCFNMVKKHRYNSFSI